MQLNPLTINNIIAQALAEDIGHGDVTTDYLLTDEDFGTGCLMAKEDGTIAGLPIAEQVFHTLSPKVIIEELVKEGQAVKAGTVIANISGPLRAILTGERVALNFLQRLSAIATKTNIYVASVAGYPVKIVDTRKTTPLLRSLEKYAVRIGGGTNHRFGLYDTVMLKDNHIMAAGSITQAVKRIREKAPFTTKIEVETENLEQVEEALSNRVDIIMLDNMSIELMSKAVKIIDGKALAEASGGITLETIKEIATTGVDLISIGCLTHSIKAFDISLDIK